MKTLIKIPALITESILLLSLFLLPTSCSEDNSASNSTADPNTISIQGNAFQPANLTVTKGTTVTWTNKDSYAHTVTGGVSPNPNGTFDSGNLPANQTFSYKFESIGSLDYFCSIHTFMKAKITVVE